MPKTTTPKKSTSTNTNSTKSPKDPSEPKLITENSKLTITIPWDVVEPAYLRVLTKAAQNVKADGFRIGKVPPNIAEGKLAPQKLLELTMQDILPALYTEKLKKTGKTPISQPEIEPVAAEKGKDWVFNIYFAERPVIDVKNYQKIVKKAEAAAEKEIAEVNKARETKKTEKAEDKEAEAAQAAAAKPLTDQEKEDIRLKHIFRGLVSEIKPGVPEMLVRSEMNRELQRLTEQLQQFKLSADDYLKSRQITIEQLRQEYAGIALSSLQIEFILAEIGKEQKLGVEENEIDEALKNAFADKLTPEIEKNSEYRTYFFSTLLKQKVLKHLLSV